MKIFGVCGNPILHSLSPKLFHSAYGSEYIYIRLIARTPEEVLRLFYSLGMSGVNVTAPFKDVNMWGEGVQNDDVKIIGVMNTIVRSGDVLMFYNTDIDGVTSTLGNIEGLRCLVLGAGGAGIGAVYALKKLGAQVTVANRTVSRAKAVAEKFGCDYCSLEKLPDAEIIVNTLHVKMMEPTVNQIFVDAIYHNSPYLDAQCNYINGLEWLKGQAVSAYRLFTSCEAVIGDITLTIPKTINLVGIRAEEVKKKFPAELIDDGGMEIWLYDGIMEDYLNTAWAVIDATTKTNDEIYEEIYQSI